MEALEKCLLTAKNSGVSREQAESLISKLYIPLPWQWRFHAAAREADKPDGPVDIGVGGARGPGKSHAVLSQAALDDCQRHPRLKGLFLRQTGVSAKESFDDLVDKVLVGHVTFKRTMHTLSFENGSRIILGGFKDEKDIDKYIGIEYDFIIVEELNQLTADKYTKLRGSLRTSKPDWRPRMYTSFNPGGTGHSFVKERYILPHRFNKEESTRFIGSTYKSNPYLNNEYIEYLESLTGDLGKAWREGEWDLFAGQAFSELRGAVHIIDPIELTNVRWFAGYDQGFNHPFAFILFALTEDGIMYVTNYIKSRLKRVDEICELIKQITPNMKLNMYAGQDIWTKQRDGGPSVFEQMLACGLKPNLGYSIIKSSMDRIQGVAQIRKYLAYQNTELGKPKLYFFKNARAVYDNVASMQFDPGRPEDVMKVDADENGNGGDDLYDAFRYGLMSRVIAPKPEDQKLTPDQPAYWLEKRLKEAQMRRDIW